MRKSRKAQIHMMETIFVLLVVFVLIGFGLIFYAKYSETQNQKLVREKLSKQAVDISLRSALLPELQCSREGALEPNCIDIYKLKALKKIIEDDTNVFLYYQGIFKSSSISLDLIYPKMYSGQSNWVLYNQTPVKIKNAYVITVPITIQDPSQFNNEINYFGTLTIKVFE